MLKPIGIILAITVILYIFSVNDGFSCFCNDTASKQADKEAFYENYFVINKFNTERDYSRE